MTDTSDSNGKDGRRSPIIGRISPPVIAEASNDEAILIRLAALEEEHRDLDQAINALSETPMHDRLAVARLKKKKLALKDEIVRLKDLLTPDIIA